uniref:Sodium/solute symporter n=1 Tax=Rhodnius prolixus TaxID=13249 RepID=T1HMC2_RHOPR
MSRVDVGRFDFAEYTVFTVSLALSATIGFYFGCIKGGQDTVSGYLLGGKRMSVFPIAMSLVTTYISGVTLLGVPTEIYTFGTQYLMGLVSYTIVSLFIAFVILPVFYKLQLISLFELAYLPIVIYGPALALNQVSGMNIHVITPVVCTVCIFYTTLGGLKAVVWSDTLQGTVMIGSVLAVLFLGLNNAGGVSEVLNSSIDGDRIEFFNMDINPTTRLSFWSATIGMTFYWLANFAYSPASVQRFISLPTFKEARLALCLLCLGVTAFTALNGVIGLIIYTKYKGCDPLSSEAINRPDQIVPLFVLEVSGHIRGLPGLFMSGVVCAALSSLSTGMNTVAGTIYEDFVEPLFSKKPSEKQASFIMKALVVLFGTTCVLLVFVFEKLGHLIELTTGFVGMTAGTTLGIFLLGMFFPSANTKGTLTGGIVSLIFMTWLLLGNSIATAKGLIKHTTKPVSTELCTNMTFAQISTPQMEDAEIFPLYRISVFYYSVLGCGLVILIGLPISLLTSSKTNKEVDPALLSPLVKYFYENKRKHEYSGVPLKKSSVQ